MSARMFGNALEARMQTHVAKLILLKMTDACEDDGTRVYPGIASMARVAQCSTRHAKRIVGEFRTAGLIILVRPGGSGPGDTAEYRFNMALFERLVAHGWDEVFGPGKGDTMESPFSDDDDAKKGDMVSPFKGDIGDNKGDICDAKGDSIESPDPSIDPSNRPIERDARARAREGDASLWAHLPDAGLLARLRRKHQKGAAADAQTVGPPWRALTEDQRKAAVDRYDDWEAHVRAQGQGQLPGLVKYLQSQMWEVVPKGAAKPAAGAGEEGERWYAPAFSRAWSWLYWRFVRQNAAALKDRTSAQHAALQKRVSLARHGVGWPVDAGEREMVEEAAKDLRSFPLDAPEVVAAQARLFVDFDLRMPEPDKAGVWVFLPDDLAEPQEAAE